MIDQFQADFRFGFPRVFDSWQIRARCNDDGCSTVQAGPDCLLVAPACRLDTGGHDDFQGFQFGQAAFQTDPEVAHPSCVLGAILQDVQAVFLLHVGGGADQPLQTFGQVIAQWQPFAPVQQGEFSLAEDLRPAWVGVNRIAAAVFVVIDPADHGQYTG